MNLSTEQLKEVENMSALFFPLEDIASNIEVDAEELKIEIQLKTGDVYLAYLRGRLKTEMELRTAIKQAAMNGSSPAQSQMINFYKDSII